MQVAAPFVSEKRVAKVHRYRRVHLRAAELALQEERQRKKKLAKLAKKRYDHDYAVEQQQLKEAS